MAYSAKALYGSHYIVSQEQLISLRVHEPQLHILSGHSLVLPKMTKKIQIRIPICVRPFTSWSLSHCRQYSVHRRTQISSQLEVCLRQLLLIVPCHLRHTMVGAQRSSTQLLPASRDGKRGHGTLKNSLNPEPTSVPSLTPSVPMKHAFRTSIRPLNSLSIPTDFTLLLIEKSDYDNDHCQWSLAADPARSKVEGCTTEQVDKGLPTPPD